MIRLLRREFTHVGKVAAQAFEDGGQAAIAVALASHQGQLIQALTPHWLSAAERFGGRVLNASPIKAASYSLDTKEAGFLFEQSIREWIAQFGALKVTRIAETTRKRIRLVIEASGSEGVDATARKIVDTTGGAIGRARASIIARTEVHAAANFSSKAAVKAVGIEQQVRKEWISAEGGRTRETHRAADGQAVATDDRFQVGAAALDHPGDPTGPAKEIIHCRCAMGYLTD